MIFPREVVIVFNDCLSFISRNKKHKPLCDFGYRFINYNSERWPAHRLSYNLNVYLIPRLPIHIGKGMILHSCDNKWCINPWHLYFGDRSENSSDVWIRGDSQKLNKRRLQAKLLCNENNANSTRNDRIKRAKICWETRRRIYGPTGNNTRRD